MIHNLGNGLLRLRSFARLSNTTPAVPTWTAPYDCVLLHVWWAISAAPSFTGDYTYEVRLEIGDRILSICRVGGSAPAGGGAVECSQVSGHDLIGYPIGRGEIIEANQLSGGVGSGGYTALIAFIESMRLRQS